MGALSIAYFLCMLETSRLVVEIDGYWLLLEDLEI